MYRITQGFRQPGRLSGPHRPVSPEAQTAGAADVQAAVHVPCFAEVASDLSRSLRYPIQELGCRLSVMDTRGGDGAQSPSRYYGADLHPKLDVLELWA